MKRIDEIDEITGACTAVVYRKLGRLQNNVYCLDDGAGGVIVVDPEYSAEAILEMVQPRHVSAIFITHRHNDHIGALSELKQACNAPVYASAIDASGIENPGPPHFGHAAQGCPVDVLLNDGDTISVGKLTWEAWLTPGHTEGSMCYYLQPEQAINPTGLPILLSGDTLFCGTIGRTDFEGGSLEDMRTSMRKLSELPDETMVLPGHEDITSIGAERKRVLEPIGNGGMLL